MKKPIICDYEYSNRAIYRRDLEKYINHLESQNKELIEREQRIRKFWDVSPYDFDVIANGKGTLECGTQIRNQ